MYRPPGKPGCILICKFMQIKPRFVDGTTSRTAVVSQHERKELSCLYRITLLYGVLRTKYYLVPGRPLPYEFAEVPVIPGTSRDTRHKACELTSWNFKSESNENEQATASSRLGGRHVLVTRSFAHRRARNALRREVPGTPLLLLDPTPP